MKKFLAEVENEEKLLRSKCGDKGYEKLAELNNPKVTGFIAKCLKHCNPDSAFVRSNPEEDEEYIRERSVEIGEEKPLKEEGHTVHFDGPQDQARDKENTKFLLPPNKEIGSKFNSIDKEEGLKEIHEYLRDIMEGKEATFASFVLGQKIPNFLFLPSRLQTQPMLLIQKVSYTETDMISSKRKNSKAKKTSSNLCIRLES